MGGDGGGGAVFVGILILSTKYRVIVFTKMMVDSC